MKRLILMRHAKSDWSSGTSSDHDRPLNARGRQAAADLGHWLVENALMPEEILCSSATRTGETYLRLGLPERIAPHFSRALYLASHNDILTALRGATKDVVLMIGHNPGISVMASGIVKIPPDHAQFESYPTGATLVADFDIADWKEADWGQANARHFVVPREL